jgi:hypothetical protein
MRHAVVDSCLHIGYSQCFACSDVLVTKVWLCGEVDGEHTQWAMDLLTYAPRWRWTRTGVGQCRRVCGECVYEKFKFVSNVLHRGYGRSGKIRVRSKSLVDLVDTLNLGTMIKI